jgi:hypothetical protein
VGTLPPMKSLLVPLAALALLATTGLAQKPKIASQDQLPRFSYPFTGPVTEVLRNEAVAEKLAAAVRADVEKLLADHEIEDRSTLQDLWGTLLALDLHAGRHDEALRRIAQIRALDEKPAAKLTGGLLTEAIILTRRRGDFASAAAFRAAFQQVYAEKLAALPWDVVGDIIKQTKGNAEIMSEALVLGNLASQFQPGVDRSGALSGDVARVLLAQRVNVAHYLPLKAERVAALSAIHRCEQEDQGDIWAARAVVLDGAAKLHARDRGHLGQRRRHAGVCRISSGRMRRRRPTARMTMATGMWMMCTVWPTT